MNLTTTYLGMTLRSPLVVSASPLSESIENIKRMEDAGAGAIVLYSLFEEQVRADQQVRPYQQTYPSPNPNDRNRVTPQFRTGLADYVAHLQKAKESVAIPVIASLNCTALGSWIEYAEKIQEAGADALELNIYFIPTDIDMTSEQTEELYIRILKAIKTTVHIPVAVKLSPFFTNMTNMARRLDQNGANGLVLFNRFYAPDFDPKTLRVQPNIQYSTAQDLRLPIHWIAILYGRLKADLVASGGIHTAEDVVKVLMVGAKVATMTSALFQNGIEHLRVVADDLVQWMKDNDYTSVAELSGLTSLFNSKDPGSFERSEYVRAITAFRSIV